MLKFCNSRFIYQLRKSTAISGHLNWSQSSIPSTFANGILQHRNYMIDRSFGPQIKAFNKIRKTIKEAQEIRLGKEIAPRRSDFTDWNYESELYAFSNRIQESFDPQLLREAFVDPSYAEKENELLEGENLDLPTTEVANNKKLEAIGLKITKEGLIKYIRAAFPYLPEEGVQAIQSYLLELDLLAETSFLLGTRDLIMTEVYPPTKEMYCRTLMALIGALSKSQGIKRAERFVIDIIGAQIHACQDINEIWKIDCPMRTLVQILKNDGRSEPESRLLWVSGKNTMLACYYVGIYCNKELIGQAPGETADIAEEMAARDALRQLFRTQDNRDPLPLGDALEKLNLKDVPNLPVREWSNKKLLNLVKLES